MSKREAIVERLSDFGSGCFECNNEGIRLASDAIERGDFDDILDAQPTAVDGALEDFHAAIVDALGFERTADSVNADVIRFAKGMRTALDGLGRPTIEDVEREAVRVFNRAPTWSSSVDMFDDDDEGDYVIDRIRCADEGNETRIQMTGPHAVRDAYRALFAMADYAGER